MDLGWHPPTKERTYLIQDLERVGVTAGRALSHENRGKILKRYAVALRTVKGSSLDKSLKPRAAILGNGDWSAAALGIVVTAGKPQHIVAGEGVDGINDMSDIYEEMGAGLLAHEWGEVESGESDRRLTDVEKADLALNIA